MTEREKTINRDEYVKRKTKKFFILFIFAIMAYNLVVLMQSLSFEDYYMTIYICIDILLILILYATYFLIKRAYSKEYDWQMKKEEIDKKLDIGKFVEVVPINADIQYHTFVVDFLPTVGKFYATKIKDYNNNDKGININFKLDVGQKVWFFTNVSKEKFPKYFEIKE